MPILTPDDGLVARTPEEAQALQFRGYQQCYGTRSSKAQGAVKGPCDFHLAPEAQEYVKDKGGYYTCPRCYQSHDLMHDLPWHGVPYEENRQGFSAGGGTRIGLSLKDQSQIGEDLVQGLGERQGGLPGYGPVTWVHPGGSVSQSPLDMATAEWGIEVKTLGYDAIHHRFIPGRAKEKSDKNAMAVAKNLKGVLGLLVILNYRTGLADIYAREFPVNPVTGAGVGTFRSGLSQHLIAEVPFKNPFMDPNHPAPTTAGPVDNQGEEMPF
jgi:hypothetical protein